jgi:zinc protease
MKRELKRNLLSTLFVSMVCMGAFAQIDRTKAPQAGKAPVIQLPKYQTFTIANGLKVFVVENHKAPKVALSLVLDITPVREGNKAGYVEMAGQLMKVGTKSRSKEQIDKEIDFIGASLGTSSTGIYAGSLKKHLDKTLNLMADVLLNPSFPQVELDKLKKQTISGLQSNKDDANAIARNVRTKLVFGDHPYGEITTEKTVENITIEDCKKYYETYFRPNTAYLAIVGDISVKEAKKLVEKYFGAWQQGTVPYNNFSMPAMPIQTGVALVEKVGAVQSVVNISYPVELRLNSEDYLKALVVNQLLGGSGARLYLNLREDKGYTYGAYSSLTQNKNVGDFNGSASVRTAVTDSSVTQFLYEMKRIRTEKVKDDELKRTKAVMSGAFARSMEEPQTIANFAINTARYNLPADFYQTYLQRLEAVTTDDILMTAQKYILPEKAHIVVVGDANAVQEKLKPFGKVTKYDMYGNVDNGADRKLLVGMTTEKILKKYFEALGGEKKLRTIKTLKQVMTAEVQGMAMDMERYQTGTKYLSLQKIPAIGMEIKQLYDGKKGVLSSPQGKQEITDEKQLASMQNESVIFMELDYAKMNTKAELTDVKMINDKPCYEITFKKDKGNIIIVYYDVATGLKEQTISDGNTTTYKNYKEVGGIKLPYSIEISIVAQKLKIDAETKEYQLNPKLDEVTLFKMD